jgi:hypothetical protein
MSAISADLSLSLFGGVDELVSNYFKIKSCRHWSALFELHRRGPSGFDGSAFVRNLLSQVSANWDRCLAVLQRDPSTENWRWYDPKLRISPKNISPEVTLERAAVNGAAVQGRQDWSNQIPIASGLISGAKDRRRAIDLVHQRGPEAFDFLELKIGSDNPLYAAIEILGLCGC